MKHLFMQNLVSQIDKRIAQCKLQTNIIRKQKKLLNIYGTHVRRNEPSADDYKMVSPRNETEPDESQFEDEPSIQGMLAMSETMGLKRTQLQVLQNKQKELDFAERNLEQSMLRHQIAQANYDNSHLNLANTDLGNY